MIGQITAWIALTAAVLNACAAPHTVLYQPETMLDTGDETKRLFHTSLHLPYGTSLNFPGYIVGVEKTSVEIMLDQGNRAIPTRFTLAAAGDLPAYLRPEIPRLLEREDRTFVSHILAYDASAEGPYSLRTCPIFDMYDSRTELYANLHPDACVKLAAFPVDRATTGWRLVDQPRASGWRALELLGQRLEADLKAARQAGRPFTHVVLATMGWNTPQDEAIRNFNSLMGNALDAGLWEHSQNGEAMPARPLFIGFTWPSMWGTPFFDSWAKMLSYSTKAKDADEVGALWINLMANGVLADLKAAYGFRVVLVGHSFGARAMSRAVFSAPLLRTAAGAEVKPNVDLLIGLQGAFSARRFDPAKSSEGAPYREFKKAGAELVFTASDNDTAVTMAFWSEVMGDAESFHAACTEDGDQPTRPIDPAFVCVDLKNDGSLKPYRADGATGSPVETRLMPNQGRIHYVDASNIFRRNAPGTGGGAHSDIYTPQAGRFLWETIRDLAPTTPQAMPRRN